MKVVHHGWRLEVVPAALMRGEAWRSFIRCEISARETPQISGKGPGSQHWGLAAVCGLAALMRNKAVEAPLRLCSN